MTQDYQLSPPISLAVKDLLGSRGGSHALELKVVAHVHAWLDEAVTVLDADALVAEGHIGRYNHLYLRASLPWGIRRGWGGVIYQTRILLVCHMEGRWAKVADMSHSSI